MNQRKEQRWRRAIDSVCTSHNLTIIHYSITYTYLQNVWEFSSDQEKTTWLNNHINMTLYKQTRFLTKLEARSNIKLPIHLIASYNIGLFSWLACRTSVPNKQNDPKFIQRIHNSSKIWSLVCGSTKHKHASSIRTEDIYAITILLFEWNEFHNDIW